MTVTAAKAAAQSQEEIKKAMDVCIAEARKKDPRYQTVFDAFVTFDRQGIAHFQWIGSDVEEFAFKKCMAAHGMVIELK